MAKKKKETRTACYLVWVDSTYVESDQFEIDKADPPQIHTVGWLNCETKTKYTVVQEIHSKDGWHRRTTDIPKRCVDHFESWEVEI